MNVIEHKPQTFFLLKADDGYYLDVNCSRSFVGFTITLKLIEDEASQYEKQGFAYANELAEDVNNHQDDYSKRHIGGAIGHQIHEAIMAWNEANKTQSGGDSIVATKTLFGRCLCGNIQFKVDGDPIWVGYCHCDSCRRATGAAAVVHVGVNPNDLTFTQGERKIYQSSPGVERGFCGNCGTPMSYQADRFPDYIQLYVGTFEQPEQFRPMAHVHVAEQLPWFNVADDLPRHQHSAAEGGDWRDS